MDKKFDLRSYLKGDKRKLAILILAAAGILLMLFSLPSKSSSEEQEGISLSEYKENLEKELSELCSSVSGAGKCRVKVSFSEGEKSEYRGSNKISSTPPRVLGVSIVCQGADRADVRNALCECMTSLFDIGANRVAILKMK